MAPAQTARCASADGSLERGPGIRAFAQQYLQPGKRTPGFSQGAAPARLGEQAVNVQSHVFRGGVFALQLRYLVQVAVVEPVQHAAQLGLCQPDVDQQLQLIQSEGAEL